MDKTFIAQTISTAVKYLGDKIDNLRTNPQKVELDLTSKAIEKLQEIDVREMNKLVSELQAVASGQAKSSAELVATLQAFEKATKDDSRLIDVLKTSQNLQRQTLTAIEKMKQELKPEKDDKEYRALRSLEKAVQGIKFEQKETDLSSIKLLAKEVASMRIESTRQSKALVAELRELYTCMKALPSQIKLEVPKTFKLDNEQLRSIRSGGGGALQMAPMDAPNSNFYADRKVVTTAGTAVALSATKLRCENVVITAESDNTGIIAVGNSDVVAAEGSQKGAILTPLGSIRVGVGDLSKIYIDATVNGDGVTFAYEN